MAIDRYGAEMTESEIDEFLESQGVGTLALGNEEGGYGIPMSFGYDSFGDRCVFQFAVGDDSTKKTFIEEGNCVSLSVFEWSGVYDWWSVVVRGTLHHIPDEESTDAAGIFASQAKVVSPEVFRQPLEELDLKWYELNIDDKHGRHAGDDS